MIAQQLSGEKIGKIIPDVFVSSIYLLKEFDDGKIDFKINLNLRDSLNENNTFNWLENENLLESLKIRTISVTDEKLYNDIILSASLTSSFISDISNTTSSKNLYIKDLTAYSFLKNYKNLRQVEPEIDENNNKLYYLYNSVTNSTSEKQKVDFIATFCFSYYDGPSSKIIGAVKTDIVLKNRNVPDAFFYQDPLNSNILDRIDNGEEYKKISIQNFKIKDLRYFNNLQINKINLQTDNLVKKTHFISDLYLSRNPSKQVLGGFYVNIDSLLSKYSSIYRFFRDINNESVLKVLRSKSKIKNLKIYRKKHNTLEKDLDFAQLGILSRDDLNSNILISATNDNFTLREIDKIYSKNNKDGMIRYFNFIDKSMSNITDGIYKYGMEISLFDGSSGFLDENIFKALTESKKTIDLYLKDVIRENKDSKRINSSKKFYDLFKLKHEKDVIKLLLSVTKIILIYNPSASEKDIFLKMSSLLHPLSATSEDIDFVSDLIDQLFISTNALYDMIQRETKQKDNIRIDDPRYKEILDIQKWFEGVTYAANEFKKTGIEYLSYLPIDERQSSKDSKFDTLRDSTWKSRYDREIRKFFTSTTADTSTVLQKTTEMPFAEELSNISINSGSFAFVLSPAFIDITGDSYDLVSPTYDISQNIHTQIALNIDNLNKNKFDNKDNIPAGAFYSLQNMGFTVDSFNSNFRTGEEASVIGLLYDVNSETQKESRDITSLYKVDKLFSLLEANNNEILGSLNSLDYTSDAFIVKQLYSSKLSKEEIIKFLQNLPLQVKSAIYSNIPPQNGQTIFKLNEQTSNPLFYKRFEIDYCLLKKIQYLKNTYFLDKKDNITVQKSEEWEDLTTAAIASIRSTSNSRYLMCRLRNYDENSISAVKIRKNYDLPLYNEYFIYDLESKIINDTSQKASEDKMSEDFMQYNVRTDLIKFEDRLDKVNSFKEQIKKILEAI